MPIDIGRFVSKIRQDNPALGLALDELQTGINGMAKNLNVDATGKLPAPPPIGNVAVKANNGLVHIVLTHDQPIQKGIQYLVEADTNPSFPQPHQIDMGSSRSHFTRLPALDDGGTPHTWYFRAQAQYHGSDPTEPVNFGSKFAPTGVSVGGTDRLTPIPSTGSGTSSGTGLQGGKALGVDFNRL
jgi:hypothetical protein